MTDVTIDTEGGGIGWSLLYGQAVAEVGLDAYLPEARDDNERLAAEAV